MRLSPTYLVSNFEHHPMTPGEHCRASAARSPFGSHSRGDGESQALSRWRKQRGRCCDEPFGTATIHQRGLRLEDEAGW